MNKSRWKWCKWWKRFKGGEGANTRGEYKRSQHCPQRQSTKETCISGQDVSQHYWTKTCTANNTQVNPQPHPCYQACFQQRSVNTKLSSVSKAELRSGPVPGILNQLQMGHFAGDLKLNQCTLNRHWHKLSPTRINLNSMLVGHAELLTVVLLQPYICGWCEDYGQWKPANQTWLNL